MNRDTCSRCHRVTVSHFMMLRELIKCLHTLLTAQNPTSFKPSRCFTGLINMRRMLRASDKPVCFPVSLSFTFTFAPFFSSPMTDISSELLKKGFIHILNMSRRFHRTTKCLESLCCFLIFFYFKVLTKNSGIPNVVLRGTMSYVGSCTSHRYLRRYL